MKSISRQKHSRPATLPQAASRKTTGSRLPWRWYRYGKSMALAVCLVLALPLTASATPFYEYFYTGNLFTEPSSPAPDDPRNGSSLSLKITSPTPLDFGSFDQKSTPGLNFSMSDGAFPLHYPTFYGPLGDGFTSVAGSAALVIYELSAAGLPTAWSIYIAQNLQDPRGHPWDREVLASSYNSPVGDVPWDNSYIEGLGPQYVVNDPGQWRLFIQNDASAVPEPALPLLFGVGIIVLAATRKWKKPPQH